MGAGDTGTGDPPPVQAHSWVNTGGPLNALGVSPDGNSICVVGREVLKIYNILEDSTFKERMNLRVGKVNLNFSSVDVKWHPMNRKYKS